MEKFIFFASLKKKFAELNIPQETVEKHIAIFEKCFEGKTAAEIDAVIESTGGIDGIVQSVYNLEKTKSNAKNTDIKNEDSDSFDDAVEDEPIAMTKEISSLEKSEKIEEHIREAEDISDDLEKTTVNKVVRSAESQEEFSNDISEYDFDILFAEKLSLPEKWVKALKEKMNEKTYKATLPLAIIAAVLIFAVAGALFPLLIASAIFVSIVYIAVLVAGVCFALVPIGYSIYMSFIKSATIALYEFGLGLIVLGITLALSILLYNYVKRLVPFLFKQLKKLFALCIRIAKRYFSNTVKEK